MKAKFKLNALKEFATASEGVFVEANFLAVTSGADNESWSKWTPSGELNMTITNPSAVASLKVGSDYILTFSPATE